MAVSLGRFLNVRHTERPRLAWLYAMLFSSIIGVIWGEAVLEAGFLKFVGVQYLPLAIAGSALVSMGSISIYNLFADRIANHKLLATILTVAILVIGAGVLLLENGKELVAFPLLFVADSVLFRDLLNVHWPIYVNSFFDTQSAKRVVPVLSSATRLAAIIGGLTMPILNNAYPPKVIISIMLLMQVAMLVLALLMRRSMGDPITAAASLPLHSGRNIALTNIQEGYRYVRGSKFLRWIALTTLLAMVLLAFLNYQTGRLLLANLKTVQNIANFTGLMSALGNLVALPLQLFFLSRLIGRAGVGNAALVYPATTMLAVTGLTLAPGFSTAGLGYLTRTVLRTTFNIPIDSLLYNAVPLRIKARARGFISGYVMTTGSLAGGILIMALNQGPALPALSILFGVLAAAYLVSAFQVRRHYGKAVVAMVEQDDFVSMLSSSDTELTAVDNVTINRLANKMGQVSANPDMKVFLAQVICQVGDVQAIPILDRSIRETRDGHLRARLLEVLAASGTNQAEARTIYIRYLHDPEKEVRQAALAGLERSTGDDPVRFQILVSPLLIDKEIEVRAAALSALVQNQSFFTQPAAGWVLDSLLESDKPGYRSQGVRNLGRLVNMYKHHAGAMFVSRLLASFHDASDEVRLAASQALEEDTRHSGRVPEWLPQETIRLMLSDPVERVRHTAAILLTAIPQPEAREMLVELLADSSHEVRLAAADGLVKAGPVIIDLVQPLLESKNLPLQTMSATILGRIDAEHYQSSILSGYVTNHLEAVYRNWGYLAALACTSPSPILNLLQSSLSEQNSQLMEEIFSVLGAIHPPQAVDKIAVSIYSPDQIKRANALEALEVLTTPQIARLFGALVEQPPDLRMIFSLGSTTWGHTIPDINQTLSELKANAEDPWLSDLAAAAASITSNP